jgi:hypothetical protein
MTPTKPCLALALILPAALASAAHADAPGAVTASEPPPVEDARLSQINGTPIKVGEHNEYYYDFKRWNVSANPLGWMLGLYGVSASYGLTDNVALRADVNYFNQIDGDEEGVELGIGAPIYFRRTYQGVFLEPGVIYRRMTDGDASADTVGPQVLVGWQWLWDSGLNVAIAAGVGRNFTSNDSDGDSELFANGYLRFGYAF